MKVKGRIRWSLASLSGGLLLLGLGGCTAADRPYDTGKVGTGWSRAPDLSVYGAMDMAGELAREAEVLCRGTNPGAVAERWRAEFAAREAWIRSVLVQRYGAAAVEMEEAREVGRIRCPTIPNKEWRRNYAQLLRVLELRLYPPEHWEALS